MNVKRITSLPDIPARRKVQYKTRTIASVTDIPKSSRAKSDSVKRFHYRLMRTCKGSIGIAVPEGFHIPKENGLRCIGGRFKQRGLTLDKLEIEYLVQERAAKAQAKLDALKQ